MAASIQPGYTAGEALARNFAEAYAGMTVEELYDYAVEFGKKYTESFNNMRYIDGFYLPMAELVRYLYENDFTIYVVSGTERTTTRAIVANSPIRDYVTPNHVIGTEFEVKQRGHEDEASNMNYKYADGDVREWGPQDWEKKSAEYLAMGYVPISMKTDFAQIYPEGITRAETQYQARDWSDAPWYQQNAA